MTAPTGAAVSVQDAVYDALAADAALLAYTGGVVRIWEVMAPAGTTLTRTVAGEEVPHPYLTLSGGEETEFNVLCAPGFSTPMRIRVWVPGTRERLAKLGAGHVRRILDGRALVLAGHTLLRCTVERSRPEPESDGSALQVMTDIRVESLAA